MRLLLISVGRGRYAVAADAVTRILDPERQPDFRREGGGGDAIERGVRYPVLDLHAAAGETPGPSCVYLMVEGRGGRAVLPVDSAEAIRRVCATGDQGAHAEYSDGETSLPPGGRACPGIPVSRDLTPGEGTGYGVREMGAQLRAP